MGLIILTPTKYFKWRAVRRVLKGRFLIWMVYDRRIIGVRRRRGTVNDVLYRHVDEKVLGKQAVRWRALMKDNDSVSGTRSRQETDDILCIFYFIISVKKFKTHTHTHKIPSSKKNCSKRRSALLIFDSGRCKKPFFSNEMT